MNRLKKLLQDTACQWVLFSLSLVAFCWPFFDGRGLRPSGRTFAFLFVLWLVVIAGVFLVAVSGGGDGDRRGSD
ncbi:MAG: hypothetical protein KJ621_01000 [Proteobacteria bacterium]|nr:hypothetical protein [Pseudomonadota bacterium]MBU1741517.1 hypothetical protein [Pseudomonadota bacterium]